MRRFDREFRTTNGLRTVGIDNLLDAARAAGSRRLIAQSYTSWPYAREGERIKNEDDRLDPDPPKGMRETLAALGYLESAVLTADAVAGTVLRYGVLYGPGTSLSTGDRGAQVEAVRRRQLPIVGDGGGIWSFVHIDDAVNATVLSIEQDKPGLYNIVDDEPAPVAEWLPALAEAIGAKPPRRLPAWLGRLAGGEAALAIMTESRGASNAKAKRELDWSPHYSSWRRGFREGLS
jgi:nucleoside-diphosphate-sugar epimerase